MSKNGDIKDIQGGPLKNNVLFIVRIGNFQSEQLNNGVFLSCYVIK